MWCTLILAGETLAMSDGIDNTIFLATLFSELNTGNAGLNDLPVICVTDNHSLFDALKSTKQRKDHCWASCLESVVSSATSYSTLN